MRPGLHNAQFLPPSVSSSHGNWTVGAHGQRENQFCETDESVHDRPRIRVNQARLHTDSLTVRTKSLVLKTRPNLVKWGHNSGWRLKLVIFENMGSWCEPVAVPCKQPSRKCSPTPQIEQHSQVALAASPRRQKMSILDIWVAGAHRVFPCEQPSRERSLAPRNGQQPSEPA